jgi:F-type H+-transporting ATPase subunit delta
MSFPLDSFGEALHQLSHESSDEKKFFDDVLLLKQEIAEQPVILRYLSDYRYDKNLRKQFVRPLLGGYHQLIANFVLLLIDVKGIIYLDKIIDRFIEFSQATLNLIYGKILSASPLSSTQITAIEKKLEKQYNKTIKLHNKVVKDYIGGFKVFLSSQAIDNSVIYNLNRLKQAVDAKGGF